MGFLELKNSSIDGRGSSSTANSNHFELFWRYIQVENNTNNHMASILIKSDVERLFVSEGEMCLSKKGSMKTPVATLNSADIVVYMHEKGRRSRDRMKLEKIQSCNELFCYNTHNRFKFCEDGS